MYHLIIIIIPSVLSISLSPVDFVYYDIFTAFIHDIDGRREKEKKWSEISERV